MFSFVQLGRQNTVQNSGPLCIQRHGSWQPGVMLDVDLGYPAYRPAAVGHTTLYSFVFVFLQSRNWYWSGFCSKSVRSSNHWIRLNPVLFPGGTTSHVGHLKAIFLVLVPRCSHSPSGPSFYLNFYITKFVRFDDYIICLLTTVDVVGYIANLVVWVTAVAGHVINFDSRSIFL